MNELLSEYLDVVTDPAHVAAEFTFIMAEAVIGGLILRPFIKRWVKKHDREHHQHEPSA